MCTENENGIPLFYSTWRLKWISVFRARRRAENEDDIPLLYSTWRPKWISRFTEEGTLIGSNSQQQKTSIKKRTKKIPVELVQQGL